MKKYPIRLHRMDNEMQSVLLHKREDRFMAVKSWLWNSFTGKTAISTLVTFISGQFSAGSELQPVVKPNSWSSAIHLAPQ
jgi:hypothetical protein